MSNMNNLRQEGGLPRGLCLPLAPEGGRALVTRALLFRFSVYEERPSHACWPKSYQKARREPGGLIHLVSCSRAGPFFKHAIKKSPFLKKLLLMKSVSYWALCFPQTLPLTGCGVCVASPLQTCFMETDSATATHRLPRKAGQTRPMKPSSQLCLRVSSCRLSTRPGG